MSIHINWRLASRLSVVTFALLVIIVVAVVQHDGFSFLQGNSTSTSGLQGTDLGGVAAPNFRLLDQNNQPVSLAQFKGQPVVLTFLYTHCPDVCPLTAERIHSTLQLLGNDAQHVGVLAVSTDPLHDDRAAALTFTQQHNMQGYWHFLLGTQEQLAPVWSSYHVAVQEQQTTVNHSSALYVIDKNGHERVYFDGGDFKPDDLANDLRALLNENE